MKTFKVSLFILLTSLITSCAVTKPYLLTNNPIGSKTGKSTSVCLFAGGFIDCSMPAQNPVANPYTRALSKNVFEGSVTNGIMLNQNLSVAEAAREAGITKIATVDIRTDWYVLFSKKTYIVTGE